MVKDAASVSAEGKILSLCMVDGKSHEVKPSHV